MFKVNNKKSEQRQWRRFKVFIVNFVHVIAKFDTFMKRSFFSRWKFSENE